MRKRFQQEIRTLSLFPTFQVLVCFRVLSFSLASISAAAVAAAGCRQRFHFHSSLPSIKCGPGTKRKRENRNEYTLCLPVSLSPSRAVFFCLPAYCNFTLSLSPSPFLFARRFMRVNKSHCSPFHSFLQVRPRNTTRL